MKGCAHRSRIQSAEEVEQEVVAKIAEMPEPDPVVAEPARGIRRVAARVQAVG